MVNDVMSSTAPASVSGPKLNDCKTVYRDGKLAADCLANSSGFPPNIPQIPKPRTPKCRMVCDSDVTAPIRSPQLSGSSSSSASISSQLPPQPGQSFGGRVPIVK